MLNHQLPALLPVSAFWEALPEIFDWLHGQAVPVLAAITLGANDALVRERIVDLPAGSIGQSVIEIIRFAAANRLLVEIVYRDKQGNRSTRAIEAYSLRRSLAGDVLLMAARADNGQPRGYLVSSILGAKPTQNTFSALYPIELTPSGLQSIPRKSTSSSGLTVPRTSVRRASSFRSVAAGPTYVFRCPGCSKTFNRKSL